jgi:hypothetical protein
VLAKTAYVTAGASAALINSIDFSGTVGLGSILVGILAGGANLRSRYLKDQIDGWRGNYQQSEEHGRQLEQRLKESHELNGQLRTELAEAKVVIERFQQLPNLERLVKLMSDLQERQEQRAQERHSELLTAINTHP